MSDILLFAWLRRSATTLNVIAEDLERHVRNAAFFSSGDLPEFRGRENAYSLTARIASHYSMLPHTAGILQGFSRFASAVFELFIHKFNDRVTLSFRVGAVRNQYNTVAR